MFNTDKGNPRAGAQGGAEPSGKVAQRGTLELGLEEIFFWK